MAQLDPDELDDARRRTARASRRAGPADAGESRVFVVRRRPLAVLLPVWSLVTAVIVAQLGAALPAAGIGATVVIAAVWQQMRRPRRLTIGAATDRLGVGRHASAWSDISELAFEYRYPRWAARRDHAFVEMASLSVVMRGGRKLVLARGPVFQISPRRAGAQWVDVETLLRRRARAAGLSVERAANGSGWTATAPG